MDHTRTFDEIKSLIKDFNQARGWGKSHNPKDLAMSIAIEAAELMEIFQWVPTEKTYELKDSEHLKEELADVLIYCFQMAISLDLDVASAVEEKIEKNAIKYPTK